MSRKRKPLSVANRGAPAPVGAVAFGRCAGCRSTSAHKRKIRRDAEGNCIAVWTCTDCGTTFIAGGFCCWNCGHHRFKVAWVRASRPGELTRAKVCRKCGTRHETGECAKRVVTPRIHHSGP